MPDERRSQRPGDAEQWIGESSTLTTSRGHRISYRRAGSGPAVLLVHGFPTWSYDYADVATDLESDHDVVTLDLLGYGASDKPDPYAYSVEESADTVQELLAHLGIAEVHLVVHDYGGIVGQELLDRRARGVLPFTVRSVSMLNSGIVYRAYRPTRLQQLLNLPVLGKVIAGRVTKDRLRAGLAGVWGSSPLDDTEFDNIWAGVSRSGGHRISHLLIRYNRERAVHHERWERALGDWDGPLHLVWGLEDPVSGRHVLELAERQLPDALVTRLDGVGHFPQAEAPEKVAAAIRAGLAGS